MYVVSAKSRLAYFFAFVCLLDCSRAGGIKGGKGCWREKKKGSFFSPKDREKKEERETKLQLRGGMILYYELKKGSVLPRVLLCLSFFGVLI